MTELVNSRRRLFGAAALAAGLGIFAVGCDKVADLVGGVVNATAPTSSLARVDLVENPSTNTLLAWSCYEYGFDEVEVFGVNSCEYAGWSSQPSDSQLRFSFDIVFDLFNPNGGFAIPLIELLLGIDVFDGDNLGAVCVSFCDPEVEDCTPTADAEGACAVDDSTDVNSIEDLAPSVDDLVELATDVATGDLDTNFDYRVIPKYTEQSCGCTSEVVDGVESMCCGGECAPLETGCSVGAGEGGDTCALCDGHTEAHIQFDFAVDVMMRLFETLLNDAISDALAGRSVSLEIPYSTTGTLFFDVPEMGRYNLGFGPWDDVWPIN